MPTQTTIETNLLEFAKKFIFNPHSVVLVMSTERIGVQSFCVYLELRRFPPGTPLNQEYQLGFVQWEDLVWTLLVIPRCKLYQADELLAQLGLRRADGVPHLMVLSEGGLRQAHFPIDRPNMFTIENIPGHFAYLNDPALNKTAEEFEAEAIKRERTEFLLRRQARR